MSTEEKVSIEVASRLGSKARAREGSRRSTKSQVRSKLASSGVSTDGLSVTLGVRSMPIFPDHKVVKLFYNDTATITSSTVGIAGVYVFSANGLYDPNITGTGHQPIGFDQMMAFYNHYTVRVSRLIVTFRSLTANYGGWAAVAQKGTSTTVTTASQVIEDGYVVFAPLGIPSSSACVRKFESRHDVGKFQGMRAFVDNPDLSGDLSSNPTEQTYFHLSYWNDADNTNIAAAINVLIEYEAVFREPRPLTQS